MTFGAQMSAATGKSELTNNIYKWGYNQAGQNLRSALDWYAGNVMVGAPDRLSDDVENFNPASWEDVGFMDYANRNYRLSPTSSYHNQATDKTDPGANIDLLPTIP